MRNFAPDVEQQLVCRLLALFAPLVLLTDCRHVSIGHCSLVALVVQRSSLAVLVECRFALVGQLGRHCQEQLHHYPL